MHTNLYSNDNVPFLTDPMFPHKSATQKSFLSWQSMYMLTYFLHYHLYYFTAWDLLRIDVYSFRAICE